jgi:hypothetical protein
LNGRKWRALLGKFRGKMDKDRELSEPVGSAGWSGEQSIKNIVGCLFSRAECMGEKTGLRGAD